jgi:hypothetical protein
LEWEKLDQARRGVNGGGKIVKDEKRSRPELWGWVYERSQWMFR